MYCKFHDELFEKYDSQSQQHIKGAVENLLLAASS